MDKFYAKRIIGGKCTFADVPRLLKDSVREALIELGHPELVEE